MSPSDPTPNPPRFFHPHLAQTPCVGVSDGLWALDKPESHHARHVLRLSVGDAIELFDGQGAWADARIERFDAGRALCRLDTIQHQAPPRPRLTLASAIPKGPRAEAMVDQLSQLGVDRFIPLRTEHSVAVPKSGKLEKFTRLTVESAKQCRRPWLLQVEEVSTPDQAWSDDRYDLKLIAVPDGDRLSNISDRLRAHQEVLVLIGPEGGWSPTEQVFAREAGCIAWSIAPHVLRIEAAAAAAAAILRYASLT